MRNIIIEESLPDFEKFLLSHKKDLEKQFVDFSADGVSWTFKKVETRSKILSFIKTKKVICYILKESLSIFIVDEKSFELYIEPLLKTFESLYEGKKEFKICRDKNWDYAKYNKSDYVDDDGGDEDY